MAIKKVNNKMSAAPKKVAAKKSDPGKGFVTKVYEQAVKNAKTPYKGKPMTDAQKAAYWTKEAQAANKKYDQLSKNTKNTTPSQRAAMEKTNARIVAASDSAKKYTQKNLNKIMGKKP